jgi:hypothetical protein
MAAIDTFEWYLSELQSGISPDLEQYIRSQREYMLTLRSEDERQRFVEEVVREVRQRGSSKAKHPSRT